MGQFDAGSIRNGIALRASFEACVAQRRKWSERQEFIFGMDAADPELGPLSERMFKSYDRLREMVHALAEAVEVEADEVWGLVREAVDGPITPTAILPSAAPGVGG